MADSADVCVLLPTYNEATTIGDVVDGFHEQGFTDVVVVDGHSTDDTRDIAAAHGAEVFEQSGSGRGAGKGQAVREALDRVVDDHEYVVLADGDGTYDPADAPALLEPLREGRAEHVVGNRFSDLRPGAMTRLNRLGNAAINRLFRLAYGERYGDILSGYRAFTTDSARRMQLHADGFGIETEMAAECARGNVPTAVVGITYRPRPDGSATSLRPFRDGGRILLTMYLRTKTSNPLVYFGTAGVAALLAGVAIWCFVAYEWFVRHVSHDVLAVVGAFAILVGVQLLMFGALSDLVVTLHDEQLARLEERE
ncbi:MAG: S-layer glycoprotein N-glycosyltransferase AglJ [Halobacteriaceae archaeon]